MRAKGRKPFCMQVMLVAFWIAGEFTGGFVGGVVHVIRNGENAPLGMGVYLFAIAGAAMGAGFAFLCAYILTGPEPQTRPETLLDGSFRSPDPDNPYAP